MTSPIRVVLLHFIHHDQNMADGFVIIHIADNVYRMGGGGGILMKFVFLYSFLDVFTIAVTYFLQRKNQCSAPNSNFCLLFFERLWLIRIVIHLDNCPRSNHVKSVKNMIFPTNLKYINYYVRDLFLLVIFFPRSRISYVCVWRCTRFTCLLINLKFRDKCFGLILRGRNKNVSIFQNSLKKRKTIRI